LRVLFFVLVRAMHLLRQVIKESFLTHTLTCGSQSRPFFVSALLSAAVLLAQECPEVPPMECAEGDQVCPTGADDNGCAYPDVCMPAGADCPVVCAPTPPPMCGDEDVLCFMGEDDNGCLLPDTCMPAGEPCPVVCPRNPPMECAEGDQVCPMGADTNGCSFPDVCMPAGEACPAF